MFKNTFNFFSNKMYFFGVINAGLIQNYFCLLTSLPATLWWLPLPCYPQGATALLPFGCGHSTATISCSPLPCYPQVATALLHSGGCHWPTTISCLPLSRWLLVVAPALPPYRVCHCPAIPWRSSVPWCSPLLCYPLRVTTAMVQSGGRHRPATCSRLSSGGRHYHATSSRLPLPSYLLVVATVFLPQYTN